MASIFYLFEWVDGGSRLGLWIFVHTLPLSFIFSFVLALLYFWRVVYIPCFSFYLSDDETASPDSQSTVSRMMNAYLF